jgi:site-specific DNA-cytosine methylase
MKNAFRLVGLKEPEMFIVETGLRFHTAASEAFAALPDYYIQQVVVKDARKCGYPMKKRKSFLIGTKRDFQIKWRERKTEPLSAFLEKNVDCRELPAYAVNRMNGVTRSYPSVLIDPRTDTYIPNITGHYAKDDSTILVRDDGLNRFRSFTVKEISRFYGFPDSYTFVGSEKEQIRQITDSVGTGFASFLIEDVIKTYFE